MRKKIAFILLLLAILGIVISTIYSIFIENGTLIIIGSILIFLSVHKKTRIFYGIDMYPHGISSFVPSLDVTMIIPISFALFMGYFNGDESGFGIKFIIFGNYFFSSHLILVATTIMFPPNKLFLEAKKKLLKDLNAHLDKTNLIYVGDKKFTVTEMIKEVKKESIVGKRQIEGYVRFFGERIFGY